MLIRSRYRWMTLIISFYTIVILAFIVQSIPPLIPRMMNEFDISHARAGLLMSMFFIPGIFLSIPAGALVDRYGIKKVGTLSTFMIVIGCFISAIGLTFHYILLGRLIVGIGGVITIITMPVLISQWFPREEIGKAMGIYGINMPLATIISFPISSLLMLTYGWRYPLFLNTGLAMSSFMIFLLMAKIGPFKQQQNNELIAKKVLKNTEIWKTGIIWALCFASILSFTTWSPTLFEKYKSMNPFDASLYAGTLMFAAILSTPIYGMFANRIGRYRIILFSSFVLMTISLVVMDYLFDRILLTSIVALGIIAFVIVPIVLMLPPRILSPNLIGTGYGIITTCLMLGMTSAPLIVGFIIDISNSSSLGYFVMALFSALGAVVAYFLNIE